MNSAPVRRFGNLYVVAGILVGSFIGISIYQFAFNHSLPVSVQPVAEQQPTAGSVPLESVVGDLIVAGKATVVPDKIAKTHAAKAVFVMIRSAQPGAPFAVKRFDNPHSDTQEIAFTLTTADRMTPNATFPEDALLKVRFDADGIAGPVAADDAEGFVTLDKLGHKDIKVLIK